MTSEVKADPNNLLLQQAGVVLIPPVLGATAFTSNANELHQNQFDVAVGAAEQPPMTEEMKEVKRRERLEQNRLSACESRKRKKTMIEELQKSVINLSRENKELQQMNEIIKRQLLDLGAKFPNAVPLHLLSTDQQFQPQAHSVDPIQQQALPPLQTVPPVPVTPTNIVTQVAPAQTNATATIPNIVPTQQPASFPSFMTKLAEATTPVAVQQQQLHQQVQQGFNFATMQQNNIGSNIAIPINNFAPAPSSV